MNIREKLADLRYRLGYWIIRDEVDFIENGRQSAEDRADEAWRMVNFLRMKASGCEDALNRINLDARALQGLPLATIFGETDYPGGTVRQDAITHKRVYFPAVGVTIEPTPTSLKVSRKDHPGLFEITRKGIRLPHVSDRAGVPYGGKTITLP